MNAPTPKASGDSRRRGASQPDDDNHTGRSGGLVTSSSAPVVGNRTVPASQRVAVVARHDDGGPPRDEQNAGGTPPRVGKLRLNMRKSLSTRTGFGQATPGRDTAMTFPGGAFEPDLVDVGHGLEASAGRGGTAAMVRRLYTQSMRSDAKSCAAMQTRRRQREES